MNPNAVRCAWNSPVAKTKLSLNIFKILLCPELKLCTHFYTRSGRSQMGAAEGNRLQVQGNGKSKQLSTLNRLRQCFPQ